jgi:hypothetical protein
MVEPLPGHTDDEVVALLQRSGATQISILAPGFISARAQPGALEALQSIAEVREKPRSQIRLS